MATANEILNLGVGTYKYARILGGSMGPVEALYGPWNSIDDYAEFVIGEEYSWEDLVADLDGDFEETLPSLSTTIGIIENGTVVEYWNPTSIEVYVKKNNNYQFATKEDILSIFDEIDNADTENQ